VEELELEDEELELELGGGGLKAVEQILDPSVCQTIRPFFN